MTRWNIDRVMMEKVFALGHSFGEWRRQNIDDLHRRLVEGTVTVAKFRLPAGDWSTRYLSEFSGGSEHRGLCADAGLLLDSLGVPWSAKPRDLDYEGGRADLVAIGRRLAVECGYTQASKVLAAVTRGVQVLVVPYSEDRIGHLFSARRA